MRENDRSGCARCAGNAVPLQVAMRSEIDGSRADTDARSAQLHQALLEQEREIQRLSATVRKLEAAKADTLAELRGLKLGGTHQKIPEAVSKEPSWWHPAQLQVCSLLPFG